MSKLTDSERYAIAAALGGTNMGQPLPSPRVFADALGCTSLNGAVGRLWGHLEEGFTDPDTGAEGSTMDIFEDEAEGWLLKNTSEVTLKHSHPDLYELLQRARRVLHPQRYGQALAIQQGAVNPIAILGEMHRAALEANDEGKTVRSDQALMLMLHQLAHIMDLRGFDASLSAYSAATRVCEDNDRRINPGKYEAKTA